MTFVDDQAKAWTEIPHLTKLADPPPETVNGPGATMAATEAVRAQLPDLLRRYNITTVLDIGCGDWTWMQHVDLSMLTHYTGWDVDPDTITDNQRRFGDRGNVTFTCQNLLTVTDIPKVDLIIARQLLIHLPNRYISQALEKFKASGSTYLLTSTWPGDENKDDQPDGFAYRGYMERTVNLEAEPFNLTDILDAIDEPAQSAGVIRYNHYLAIFKLPPRTFHSRVHPAGEEPDSISLLGALSDFKERVDATQPPPDNPIDELRAIRDHLAEIHQIAGNNDSLGTAWLLLGAHSTALDAVLKHVIGDE